MDHHMEQTVRIPFPSEAASHAVVPDTKDYAFQFAEAFRMPCGLNETKASEDL